MTAQYQLNAKAILDKQFNVDLKGYAPREVDEFLDKVIADYQTYDETIRELGESLRNYENQVEQLKAKIAELEAKAGAEGETMPPQSQVDILKRLSRLQKVTLCVRQSLVPIGIRGKSMLAQPATAVVFVPDEDINPGRFTPDGCAPS